MLLQPFPNAQLESAFGSAASQHDAAVQLMIHPQCVDFGLGMDMSEDGGEDLLFASGRTALAVGIENADGIITVPPPDLPAVSFQQCVPLAVFLAGNFVRK